MTIDDQSFDDAMRELWREALRCTEVHDGTHFFEAGGHSMLATRIVVRTRSQLGLDLPMTLVFDAPVFADFTARVGELVRARSGAVPEGPTATGCDRGPLSLQQEPLMRLEVALGPSPANVVTYAGAVTTGAVDVGRLRAALHTVVARHDSLRTAFVSAGFGHEQVVRAAPEAGRLTVEEIDLTGLPADRIDRETRRAVRRGHREPFDLAAGAVPRIRVIRRGIQGDVLVLHLHHLVCDELSRDIVVRDLEHAYRHGDRDGPEPGGAVSYLDYAIWQQSRGRTLLRESARYWRNVVRDLVAGRPGGIPADADPSLAIERQIVDVDSDAVGDLRRRCGAAGVTLFEAVAAAVAIAIGRATGVSRVGIGTLLEGRSSPAVAGTVGLFATSTLLAVPVSDATSVIALAGLVDSQLSTVRQWSDLPLELLVGDALADAAVGADEVVDAVVTMTYAEAEAPYGGLGLRPVDDSDAPLLKAALTRIPVMSARMGQDGALRLALEYRVADRDRFRGEEILGAVREVLLSDGPGA